MLKGARDEGGEAAWLPQPKSSVPENKCGWISLLIYNFSNPSNFWVV